jgi:mannosyltransferase OCH1-like enzyme
MSTNNTGNENLALVKAAMSSKEGCEQAFQTWIKNGPGYQIKMLSESRQRKFFIKAFDAITSVVAK